MAASAWQIRSNPSPKLSRRCAVTRISRLPGQIGESRPEQLAALQAVANFQHGVDAGVAGDPNVARDAFRGQVVRGALGRREMERRQARGQNPIQLLGKGLAQVAGAQSSFDVGDGNAAIEGRQRAAESRRGVALNHD